MKKFAIYLFMSISSLSIWSQNKVSDEEQIKMIQKIEQRASTIKSFHSDFKQEKTISLLNYTVCSTGTMDYCQPDKLKWKYVNPYEYVFIINGHSIMTQDADHTNVIDARQSKIFKEVTQIMVNSLTGKCLSNKKDFNVEMAVEDGQWIASLKPIKKELSSMFKLIRLYIEPSQSFINRVDLIENTDDVTKIHLSNCKVNISIDEAIFDIH